LQGIADATVNDSLDVWNINRWNPQAGMSYVANGLEISFQQDSQNSDAFYWDFGDGNTSTLPNPVHNYSSPGDYSVRLIAGTNCISDTLEETLQVTVTSVVKNQSDSWRVFPNPADNDVLIQAVTVERFHIAVYASNGKLVKAFDEEGSQIKMDFSDLEPGIYHVVCSTRTDQKIFRIMKD
jgi:PKD repeat protein